MRSIPGRVVLSGLLICALVLLATGCTSVGAQERLVRVYSGRHYDLEKVFQRFHEETGISVEFLFAGDAELRERIKAEGDRSPADVYMTVDAANLVLAAREGILQELRSPVLEGAVPANMRDPQGRWFGLSQRVRTVVYNPRRVNPADVPTYEALGDPRWKGRLCLRNASNDYTQSLVASLIAHYGHDRALQIVRSWMANQPQFLNNDVLILQTIEAGRCDVGITNHYYLARQLADKPGFGVRLLWANQATTGVHVNISGAGVARNAQHPQEARRLLEWLANEGQQAFVEGNYELPVNPAVQPAPLLRQFGSFKPDDLNVAEFGGLNAEAVKLMDEAGYR